MKLLTRWRMRPGTQASSIFSDLNLKSRLKMSSSKTRNPCYGPCIVRMGAGFRLLAPRRVIKLRMEGCIITGTQAIIGGPHNFCYRTDCHRITDGPRGMPVFGIGKGGLKEKTQLAD